MDLWIDPLKKERAESAEIGTGIYVRARVREGEKFQNADIAHLTRKSLCRWLRSRGGKNLWAESVIGILLGYGNFAEEDFEDDSKNSKTGNDGG